MVRKAIIALALILPVGACGGDPPKSGEVVNKQYSASYVYYTSMCVLYGKYGCQISIPVPITEPQHWKLKVRDDANGKERWVEVLPEQFNRFEVGNHWPNLQ